MHTGANSAGGSESTLVARQTGTYGAYADRMDTTVSIGESSVGSATSEMDKTRLLTEKIRKKKQGKLCGLELELVARRSRT